MALSYNGKSIGDIWQGGKRIIWGILFNRNADYSDVSEGNPVQSIIYEWVDEGNSLIWALGLYSSTGCMTWPNLPQAPTAFCINNGDTADAGVKFSATDTNYLSASVTATGYEDYVEITGNTILFKQEGDITLTLSYVKDGQRYSSTVNVAIRDITFSIEES